LGGGVGIGAGVGVGEGVGLGPGGDAMRARIKSAIVTADTLTFLLAG
jgi:hypothetical protein